MNEIKKILDDNEKVLWDGKPQLTPFVASTIIVSLFGLSFVTIGFLLTFGIPIYRILVHKYTY